MSREDYVLLESFVVPEAAAVLRSRLELAGIPSMIENETVASTLWHVGSALGGTRLLVPAERLAEAQQFLAEDQASSSTPWTCTCGTVVEPGFDLCWQCGATRVDEEHPIPASADVTDVTQVITHEDASSIAEEPTSSVSDSAEAAVQRAWRASIIGLGLCPGVLHVYSLTLLSPHVNATLSPAGTRRFYGALLIDAVVLLVIVKLFVTYGP